MLASFSGCLMTFIDRTILARYSSEAFVACAAAQPWHWTVAGVLMAFLSITEIFIGRYNGAKKFSKMGPLIWQMVIVAFTCELIVIPIALLSHHLLASNLEPLAKPYLQIVLLGCPFDLAGFGAIGSFFAGRGETKMIPLVLVFTNTVNLILDILLVFGCYGLPSMGIRGAAYATLISQTLGFIIFLKLFLREKYRKKYAVFRFQWSWPLLKEFFHISFPYAVAHFCGMAGWSIAYQFLAIKLTYTHFMAYSVSFTLYTLVFFVMDGLGKGVGVICSNFIGAQQYNLLGKVLKQSFRWNGIFSCLFLIILLGFSNSMIGFFVDAELYGQVDFSRQIYLFLAWLWLLFGLDTAWLSMQNFLIALTKTKTVLLINVLCFWGIVLVPTYFLVGLYGYNSILYLQLIGLDLIIRIVIFYFWYRRRTWIKATTAKFCTP
ncbi:MAG: MATE family efflux transporter [Puniceicoccales bacterium]|jgi:MATE family multidrug resistance protein|nr:MATE family efflux transporter [Puniceicoccales bacterium]